jgi:hypothetical protein
MTSELSLECLEQSVSVLFSIRKVDSLEVLGWTSDENLEETSFVSSKGALAGVIDGLDILLDKVLVVEIGVKLFLSSLEAVEDELLQVSTELRIQNTTQVLASVIKVLCLQNIDFFVGSTAYEGVKNEFISSKTLASHGDHVTLHFMNRNGQELKSGSKVSSTFALDYSLELFALYFRIPTGNLAAVLSILGSKSLDEGTVLSL